MNEYTNTQLCNALCVYSHRMTFDHNCQGKSTTNKKKGTKTGHVNSKSKNVAARNEKNTANVEQKKTRTTSKHHNSNGAAQQSNHTKKGSTSASNGTISLRVKIESAHESRLLQQAAATLVTMSFSLDITWTAFVDMVLNRFKVRRRSDSTVMVRNQRTGKTYDMSESAQQQHIVLRTLFEAEDAALKPNDVILLMFSQQQVDNSRRDNTETTRDSEGHSVPPSKSSSSCNVM